MFICLLCLFKKWNDVLEHCHQSTDFFDHQQQWITFKRNTTQHTKNKFLVIMMGRVFCEIEHMCAMVVRAQIRTMSKKSPKTTPPTRKPETPPIQDIEPSPSINLCSRRSCTPSQQTKNPPSEQSPNPAESCAQVNVMSLAPVFYPPSKVHFYLDAPILWMVHSNRN